MSLQVWLPLISDANPIGLDRSSITANGTIAYNSGKFGNSLQFNGSSTYVQGSIYTTATMTYMCWLKFDTARGTHVLDCRTPAGVGYQPIYINPSTGVQVGGSTSSFIYINYTFTANTWYHVAVVYSASDCKLYVNGALIGSTTSAKGTAINTSLPFYIGCRCTQVNWFHGQMNDFRIYDHSCSAKEIAEVAKGLFLHYKLDKLEGSVVTDCSGYKNHGTVTGTLTAVTGTPRYGGGVKSAAGANNFIASAQSLPSTLMTVSFWCKSDLSNAWTAFADKSNYWAFFYYQSGNRFIVGTGAGDEKHATYPVDAWDTSGWNHVVIVRTGTYTKKLYINGNEITGSGGDYYTQNAGLLNIFRRNYSTTPAAVNMEMVDFRMYVTAFTAAQITALYNESVAIAKNSIVFAREFVETTSISVKKNGQLTANAFQETGSTAYFKKNGTVKGSDIYEY